MKKILSSINCRLLSIMLICSVFIANSLVATNQAWTAITAPRLNKKAIKALRLTIPEAPCSDPQMVKLFDALQAELNIAEKIPLFESTEADVTLCDGTKSFYAAYYNFSSEIVTINKNYMYFQKYDRKNEAIIRFTLCHELRHHLQRTTKNAQNKALEYTKALNFTPNQALEFDADIFALNHIAKNNCFECVFEIYNITNSSLPNDKNKAFDSKGYITQTAIFPFLDKFTDTCRKHKRLELIEFLENKLKKLKDLSETDKPTIRAYITKHLLFPLISALTTRTLLTKTINLSTTKINTAAIVIGCAISAILYIDKKQREKEILRLEKEILRLEKEISQDTVR